jgi:Ca2+-binding RTX toxin-like protein
MPPTDLNDDLIGTSAAEAIASLAGADTVNGGDGADTLSGGDGHDMLNGGAGNDVIYGHSVADIDPASGRIGVVKVGEGIPGALFGTFAPGDPGFLYVVSKNGDIIRLDLATGNKTSFMDLPANVLSTAGEGGLLGLAFAPDYATSGKFYVNVTNPAGDIEVREYTRSTSNPFVADLATARTLITIPHPTYQNHYGGFVGFSPTDGFLYISTGDGGFGGDPNNNAQNLNSLLGKILRIDVNSDGFPSDPTRNYAIPASNPYASGGGAPEVWASGLRNPWRVSFDSNGDLYIGDVGQEAREEIDYQPNGAGGRNYGWRIMEGTQPYLPVPNPPPLTAPAFDYGHNIGISVIGGYVYRGPSPGLQGAYIFSDFNAQPFYSLRIVNGQTVDVIDHRDQLVPPPGGLPTGGLTSFAVDSTGRLYFMTFSGTVYSFDPSAAAGDGGDTIHGDAGDDVLYGGTGRDALWGDAGADQLTGGDGNDIMFGGTGSDSYGVDSSGDAIGENVGEGFDAVYSTASYTLGANLEQLNLIGSATEGYGNGLANAIFGNGLANILNGGTGDDVLNGGGGDDTFLFLPGTGRDVVSDFVAGGTEDRVDLTAYAGTGVTYTLTQTGADAVFNFSNGDQIVLVGVNSATLVQSGNFWL